MNFIHSIKFRFTIWYLLVLTVLIGTLSTGVYFLLSRSLHAGLDSSLEVRATELQSIRGVLNSIATGEFREELGEVVLLYYSSGGELKQISARDVDLTLDLGAVQQALNGDVAHTTVKVNGDSELRFYLVPFENEGPISLPGRPGPFGSSIDSAVLAIGRSTEGIEQSLNGLVRTLLIAGPLTLAVAGAGGIFLATAALKPVDHITRTAREIGESDLSQRIPVQSRDELGRLASTLNQMIERLEKSFKRQQQFASDASHELRTPLAVIQAESTLALSRERASDEYKQSLEVVSHESEHMSRVIDQLLTLARADSGKEQITFEEIDLADLLREVGAHALILCREKGLELQMGQIDSAPVKGYRPKLRELFLNIVDNAVQYTPNGGRITITLKKTGERAVTTVADTGVGIPENDIPHIFERFYRVDRARSRVDGGAGLGLAISKYIAEVHGGSIEVESKVGVGSTFSVWLPAAA